MIVDEIAIEPRRYERKLDKISPREKSRRLLYSLDCSTNEQQALHRAHVMSFVAIVFQVKTPRTQSMVVACGVLTQPTPFSEMT